MKNLHKDSPELFKQKKDEIIRKKQIFMDNLKFMQNYFNDHSKIFDSVKDSLDKLPEIFEHFRDLLSKLKDRKAINDINADNGSVEDYQSEDVIIHHEHPIETNLNYTLKEDKTPDSEETREKAIYGGDGATPEEDESPIDEETGETSSYGTDDDSSDIYENTEDIETRETASYEEYDGRNGNDEAVSAVNTEENDIQTNEISSVLEDKLSTLNNHPNMVQLDDGTMDKLEDEQLRFEQYQNDQDYHISNMKSMDTGMMTVIDDRRVLGNRFKTTLDDSNDQRMRGVSSDLKNKLKNLADIFGAKQF